MSNTWDSRQYANAGQAAHDHATFPHSSRFSHSPASNVGFLQYARQQRLFARFDLFVYSLSTHQLLYTRKHESLRSKKRSCLFELTHAHRDPHISHRIKRIESIASDLQSDTIVMENTSKSKGTRYPENEKERILCARLRDSERISENQRRTQRLIACVRSRRKRQMDITCEHRQNERNQTSPRNVDCEILTQFFLYFLI